MTEEWDQFPDAADDSGDEWAEFPDAVETAPPAGVRLKDKLKDPRSYAAAMTQYAQGGTGNFGDDMIMAPFAATWAALRKEPGALFGQEMSPELTDEIAGVRDSMANTIRQQREDYPLASPAAGIAGTVAAGAGIAKAVPGIAAGVRALPWWAALPAVGAGSSAILSAGDAPPMERTDAARGALVPGAIGGIVGGGIVKGGEKVLRPVAQQIDNKVVAPLTEKVRAFLNRRKMIAAQGSPSPAITSAPGQSVRLPTGIAKGDVKMMRAEEAARQGLLGDEYQSVIGQVDDAFINDVKAQTEGIAGKAGTSEELLESGIDKFKKRAAAEKRMSSALMNARNDKLARTKIYKKYVRETFGNDLAELSSDPQNKPFLFTKGSEEIKERVRYLDNILKEEGDDIGFDELSGWYSDLSSYARSNAGKPEGVFANKVSEKYRGWLDNMARHAIKEGDEDVVDQIFKANSKYAEFKSRYGTDSRAGQSRIIQDIVQKDELTPDHLVNITFGKGLKGNNSTNQVVRRMLDAMPEGVRRDGLKGDLKAGLVMRAFEGAQKNGNVSPALLKTQLGHLRANRAFRDNLASESDLRSMDALINDLGKYVDATTRRDVYSPSGPAVLRGMEALLNTFGGIASPFGGRAVTEPIKMAVKQGKLGPDRDLVMKSLNEFGKNLTSAGKSNAKIYGAAAGGAAVPSEE